MTTAPIVYLHETPPAGGATIEVAPGILWARMPLPFRLNHVNIWLLDDGDGWTLIDTGVQTEACRAIWETLLAGRRINRLIATHGHTDHVGLAGWLVERAGDVPFWSTLTEWMSAQVRVWDARHPVRNDVERFLVNNGCDAATLDAYRADRVKTNTLLGPLPGSLQRLRDGEIVHFGGRNWKIIAAGGHAIEHASFWCENDRILIAGDQILSKISPMIGVFPALPDADPLAEYLASLPRFRSLPADTLVLPSHGLPFTGLHTRVDQLAHHHELRLDDLTRLMDAPHTAMELTTGLFQKAVAEGQARLALAETLAHANHLVGRGRAVRRQADDGRFLFDRPRDPDAELIVAD